MAEETKPQKIRGGQNPIRLLHAKFRINHVGSWPIKFFRSCPWDEWWMEFMTSRTHNGSMVYPTAWSFARKKATSNKELEVIYKAIGPKPISIPREALPKITHQGIPFLGDWQQMRARTYFYDNESVDKMRVILTTKLDGLEAGRGAATLVLEVLSKWMSYDSKLDEAFEGTPIVIGLSPLKQQARVEAFLKWKKETAEIITMLLRLYLACQGIAPDAVNDLATVAQVVGNASARAALSGVNAGATLTEHSAVDSPALNLIANAIAERGRLFRMPLPVALAESTEMQQAEAEDDDEEEKDEAEVTPDEPKGA